MPMALTCGRYTCTETNIVLRASREMKGSLTWQDSGSLGAALAYGIKVAADSLGRASVVYQMTAGGVTKTVSIVEQGAGLPWSAPAFIFSATAVIIDGASDAAGDLTVALSIGSEVVVSVGNISSHTW